MRRLSLTLLAFALAAPAQSPGQTHTYRVAGTVVSANDNHPLQRASIELLNPENFRPIQTTTSDEYGRFAFTEVPAGNHVLQGTASNYLATFYDEHEGFNTGIVTGAAVDTESLVLKLHPESVIAGIVVNEYAEPVENAAIHLFRQTHSFGDSRIVPAGIIMTNDLGHFEFPQLVPGTYFLAVIATPWYAVHPSAAPESVAVDQFGAGPLRRRGNPGSAFANSIDPSLDVAYPITFYPGTTEPAHASPITLRGGESLDLHFQLSPLPSATLTLPRSTPVNGQPQPFPRLSISFQGQVLPSSGQIIQTSTETVFSGFAPGDYVLSQNNRHFDSANVGTPIHLGDHVTEANLPAAPDSASTHVLLQSAHGASLPPRLRVLLRQRHDDASDAQFSDEKNEVTLDAAPGDYSFEVFDQQRPFAVRQIRSASNPKPLANRIHLSPGAKLSLILTILPGTHTLKGVARKNGKPSPGAFILLFPSDQAGDIRTPFRQQTDLDGSFDIPNLAPGAYTLLAIDNGWDLDWQHDGALAHYLPAALDVQILDTPAAVQYLPVPVPVQSR